MHILQRQERNFEAALLLIRYPHVETNVVKHPFLHSSLFFLNGVDRGAQLVVPTNTSSEFLGSLSLLRRDLGFVSVHLSENKYSKLNFMKLFIKKSFNLRKH